MVCLGLKPGAAGWQAQTNPLSYGGTLFLKDVCMIFLTFWNYSRAGSAFSLYQRTLGKPFWIRKLRFFNYSQILNINFHKNGENFVYYGQMAVLTKFEVLWNSPYELLSGRQVLSKQVGNRYGSPTYKFHSSGKMYTDIVKIQVIAIATKATQPRQQGN